MGLAEKRAAKEFETSHYPELKKQIDAAAGFPVPVEVKWETLAKDGEAHLYIDSWRKVYFTPLIEAFQAICVDDMGKDALKKNLKQIVVKNTAGVYYGDRIAHFEGGVLTLDHEPTTNVDDVKDRAKGIQTTLEAAL